MMPSGPQAARIARSLLFVPGNRPDRFTKALASGAHAVILDLEDAVAPAAKDEARAMVATWLAQGHPAIVRLNAADTAWYEDDLRMIREAPGVDVMLPKATVAAAERAIGALPRCRFIALLETVSGYMELPQLATTAGVERIAFGSIDFGVDSGIADEDDAMIAVRTRIVLESRAAGLEAPIDGVSPEFGDETRMLADARRSKQLGFGGKLCIHPKQAAAVNTAYRPSPEQLNWARRVVEAFESSGGAATALDNRMVDKPVFDHARSILAGL